MILNRCCSLVSLTILMILRLQESDASVAPKQFHFRLPWSSSPKSSLWRRTSSSSSILSLLRGGSTKLSSSSSSTVTSDSSDADAVRAYRLQQQLLLQSRSLQLRQALIDRGLEALAHTTASEAIQQQKVVDWECAMSTRQSPKSCLFSFDAEVGTKVIAPITSSTAAAITSNQQHQWITLAALNRLRRNDPTKVEPLWHNQYAVLKSWFSPTHLYSLYTYLTPTGTLISFLLDAPWLLSTLIGVCIVTGLLLTLPLWEPALLLAATHPVVWKNWPNWGRFIHAALPLKLLLGQLLYKFLAQNVFGAIYGQVRAYLVEKECQILEKCIPMTIIEGDSNTKQAANTISHSKNPLQDLKLLENDWQDEGDDDVDNNEGDNEEDNDDDDDDDDDE